MIQDWQLKDQELKKAENLLIEVKGMIRETEKERTLIKALKLMLLNSKKEKLEFKIKDLKQK
ncbi:MAG: hypothetical protein A2039_01430 [Candidatus Melainabacteria bacterium GWA2_34_9]|nr:MAG: hypothetical protein A2039_01430 [Candidatus Melainabacteria bacterium GWA2_34_9]